MAGFRTIASWTPYDAVFADNSTQDAAYLGFVNLRPAIVFPKAALDYYVYFRGIMPQQYQGGSIRVKCFGAGNAATNIAVIGAAIQRHPLNDPLLTLSYGTEVIDQLVLSVNWTCFGSGEISLNTAAKRDSVEAGDMFTLQFRRDGNNGSDTFTGSAYVFTFNLYEYYS